MVNPREGDKFDLPVFFDRFLVTDDLISDLFGFYWAILLWAPFLNHIRPFMAFGYRLIGPHVFGP